jgi:exopolysaccharide biosynthesis polyprenyl glycosylphosphotransferase
MFKSHRAAHTALALVTDALMLLVAFSLAWTLRDSLGDLIAAIGQMLGYPVKEWVRQRQDLSPLYQIILSDNPLVSFKNHLWIFYLTLPTWLFFLNAQRGYDPQTQRTSKQEFALCAYAGLLGSAAFLVLLFLIKFGVSRLLMLNMLLLGVFFLWAGRVVLLPLLTHRKKPLRNMLLIGSRDAAERFSEILQTPAYRWSRLMGFVSVENADASTRNATESGIVQLGTLDELGKILDREVVDEVVLVRSTTDAATEPNKWGHVLELCLQRGRTVSLVDDLVPPVGAKVEATMMGTMPTLVLHNTPQNPLGLAMKNVMDRTVAFFTLLLLSPLLALVAILIKLHDGGPIFFAQDRVGLNGRIFKFYKFRSMAVNAEAILEKMKREEPEKYRAINIMEEPFFKAKDGDDPRITPIGRFIRKYSIDEFPQFWNVLKGDMSLVGPRPPLPKEVAELEPWQRRKLSVKGGLTCIWQATGRNDITEVDEWMRLDLEYIDNWSLWLDIKLLFKTVQVLVKPKGAS